MQIECPSCGTRYRVDASRLKPEGTRVRCSTCGHRFLAFPEWDSGESWELDLGEDFGDGSGEEAIPGESGPADILPPEAGGLPVREAVEPGEAEPGEAGPEATGAPAETGAPQGRSRAAHRKGRKRQRPTPHSGSRRRASSLFLSLLVLLLLAGLVAELGYAFRGQLLAQPWVRSAVKGGLDLAGVGWELPIALRHYRAEAVNARLVTLASGRRVTLVEGLLVNDAPFDQRPPRLELRAKGPGGQVRYRKVRAPGTRFDLARAMDAEDLARTWRAARADFPETMQAGQEAPFVVVLSDVPPGVRRFQVAMVE
jgi:predicted Zn finger-like uncharacterized protein